MYYVDSHIHLSDKAYARHLDRILDVIRNSNLQVFSVSVDLMTSIQNLEIKEKYFPNFDKLFKSFVGVHPEYVSNQSIEDFDNFFISNLKRIDGIGEIGMDPTYTFYDINNTMEKQQNLFIHMLCMSEKYRKPVSLHSRKSLNDILEILPSYNIKNVCFHWFEGNSKQLKKINDLGFFVSFGPYILYTKDKQVILERTDLSLLLFETDGPVCYRNCFYENMTSPLFIISLINFASQLLKKNFVELTEIIFKNSINFIHS